LLVQLGQAQAALGACRDCECLGHFAARAREHGLQPAQLLDCLEQATRPAERYAVLLALGDFALADVPAERRQSALDILTSGYLHDGDAACHAACDWLLRQWGATPPLASVRVEPRPPAFPGTRGRDWFVLAVKGVKLSFVTLPPGKFIMGSPAHEGYRVADEGQRDVEISRPLAVLDREVTVELWRKFLDDTGRRDAWEKRQPRSPQDQQPAALLDWQEAVAFCGWLTRQAGLPDSEQCYEPIAGSGEPQWRFFPERLGFRLPTEAEWEYACRGGTQGTFSFGSDPGLLGEFAVFLDNSNRQTALVGSKRPNPRGLFDMHGNVWEWCSDSKASPSAEARDPFGPLSGPVRQYRGGSHDNFARHSRSACRISEQHTAVFPYLGLRVVCTLPALERTASER
jgi:formylglycine-generating enzyme required for sulfatase activity